MIKRGEGIFQHEPLRSLSIEEGVTVRHVDMPAFPPMTGRERIDTAMAIEEKTTKIIGKEELSHLIAAKAHLELKEADTFIDALTETVREEVAKGHQVRLIGFGSWKLTAVSARTIKSIRGGAPIHLPAGKRVSFSTGSALAEAAKPPAPVKKASPSKPSAKKGSK